MLRLHKHYAFGSGSPARKPQVVPGLIVFSEREQVEPKLSIQRLEHMLR